MYSFMGPESGGVGYTDLGERLFEEFNTRFWLRPGKNLKVSINEYVYIIC